MRLLPDGNRGKEYFMTDEGCDDEESISNELANDLWIAGMGFVEDHEEIENQEFIRSMLSGSSRCSAVQPRVHRAAGGYDS